MPTSKVSPVVYTVAMVLSLLFCLPAKTQTFTVLHSFTGGADGGNAYAGLTIDRAGNLYGTTSAGGAGYGTVFELKRSGSAWILHTLYTFRGNAAGDGALPDARVIFGPDGKLYGTTYEGGGTNCGSYGCGTVFALAPSLSACKAALCPWSETILARFTEGFNGRLPQSEVVFDPAGNLYGTTSTGGGRNMGTAYELVSNNGAWTEKVIYSFFGTSDGGNPYAGLVFDHDVNLYGTALTTVFELTPSGQGWTETTLYQLPPYVGTYAGVVFDPSGNLYGATTLDYGLTYPGGSVFELATSGSGWMPETLYSFPSGTNGGAGPAASLTIDSLGNLYGTTYADPNNGCRGGYGCGTVFKLSPNPDGSWTNTFLYKFTGGADGANPFSNVTFDSNGNLYGTTAYGGKTGNNCGSQFGYQCGVVWEITP